MKKFRNLLVIQILIGVLFGVILVSCSLLFTKHVIYEEQGFNETLIQQFSYSNLIDDPKLLTKQLKAAIDFERLLVKDDKQNVLYSFQQSKSALPILFVPMQYIEVIPTPSKLTTTNGSLIVEFQASYKNILNPLVLLLSVVFFLPVFIAVFSFIVCRFGCNQTFKKLSQQVATSINELMENKSAPPSTVLSELPQQFSVLVESLTKLNQFFTNTLEEYEKSTNDIKVEATTDHLTQLPNRAQFVEFFETEISPIAKHNELGIIMLVRSSELLHINQDEGYEAGDNYVKTIADILVSTSGTYNNAQVYRLNSSDFCVLIPGMTTKESETLADLIHSKLNEYMKVTDLNAVASMGIVNYGNGKPLGELLAAADTAISLAQQKQTNSWQVYKESENNGSPIQALGSQNWRSIIDNAIETKTVTLYFQSIQALNKSNKAYAEALARFNDHDGQIIPTAHFLAMAEKLNKVVEVDKLIVETVIDTIKKQNLENQFLGINLTSTSIHNEEFLIWLERRLLKDPQLATKLIFEVTEYGLQQHVSSSRRFIDMMHRAGARVTVEKFGVGITSFKFFQELKPDFIKLDGSYVRNIEDNKNNQYFIRMIVDLSHRIGVNVLAEYVETQEEKHVMETLMLDGCQGYYIDTPSQHIN